MRKLECWHATVQNGVQQKHVSRRTFGLQTVMVCFLTEDWKLQTCVLGTKEMRANPDKTLHRLEDVAEVFELPSFKRTAIVHDNEHDVELRVAP